MGLKKSLMNTSLSVTNNTQAVNLEPREYDFFRQYIYELAGIHLPFNPKNQSLVQNRLSRMLRKYHLGSYPELVALLNKKNPEVIEDFISNLTTNKTHFFREEAHFHYLKSSLQQHFAQNNELRIWCAASSTGQEPYTLAILLRETLNENQWNRSRILATDIDLDILAKAEKGRYSSAEMEGLSDALRKKYFVQNLADSSWSVDPQLRKSIDFARFNLVTGNYKFNKAFDFIFCRNVLIYFDAPTTQKVILNLAQCLRPEGLLFIGHSESGTALPNCLKATSQAVYKKVGPL